MHASVHIGDVALTALPRWRRSARALRTAPGLRYRVVASPAPLTETTRPQLGRFAMVCFWADREAAESRLSDSPFGSDFRGLQMGLEAVRAIGSWDGVPPLPTAPDQVHEGPAAVITIGRLRLLQARRFFAAGVKAERHVLASPGLTWGTGLAAPERRTLLTLSWWHDQAAMAEMARGEGDHRGAVAEQERKDFHHQSAFIRFRPLTVSGALTGRNGVEGLTV